jgi:hypothetical protein
MGAMKLASIINVWADCVELLPFCIANHLQFSDQVIVVWSQFSNHGIKNNAVLDYILLNGHDSRVEFHQFEPKRGVKPVANEIRKRNYGIDITKDKGFTHYLMADADEFYHAKFIELDKDTVESQDLNGMVSKLVVYIGKPTLYCDDHTLVPTIQRIGIDGHVGSIMGYPFAYDVEGNAHIDPSRRPFYKHGIKMGFAYCHHFSYVRKNIHLKINNSVANLKRSQQIIYEELRDAKPGYMSRLYHKELKECENYFNITI